MTTAGQDKKRKKVGSGLTAVANPSLNSFDYLRILLLSFLKKLSCGAQLMAHDADKLLALLQNVKIEQRHFQVCAVVLIHVVYHILAHC